MRDKTYIALPVWVASILLTSSLGFGAWMALSISDLKASVAGLQGKMELITSGNAQIAKHNP